MTRTLTELNHEYSTAEDRSAETRRMFLMNNIDRAERVKQALVGFAEEYPEGEEVSTMVVDHLADVMHLCRMNGIDFDDCLRIAQHHAFEETAGIY